MLYQLSYSPSNCRILYQIISPLWYLNRPALRLDGLCEHGPNHWIPFAEEEVGAQDCFASHFMSDFLKGKVRAERGDLFSCGDRNVAAPTDCVAPRTSRPTALDYYRSHELGKTRYDVTDPNGRKSPVCLDVRSGEVRIFEASCISVGA